MTLGAGEFWRTIGQRAIGATIVTASGREGRAGFLGLSATHVEADPPTMLVTIGRSTTALGAVLESRHFAINFLPREAATLLDVFAGKTDAKGDARFTDREWTTLTTGAPVLVTALGVFDCRLEQTIERENCTIAIGRIEAVASRADGEPLILYSGGSGTFRP